MPWIHIIVRHSFDTNVFHELDMTSPRVYTGKLHLRSEKWIKTMAEHIGRTRNHICVSPEFWHLNIALAPLGSTSWVHLCCTKLWVAIPLLPIYENDLLQKWGICRQNQGREWKDTGQSSESCRSYEGLNQAWAFGFFWVLSDGPQPCWHPCVELIGLFPICRWSVVLHI